MVCFQSQVGTEAEAATLSDDMYDRLPNQLISRGIKSCSLCRVIVGKVPTKLFVCAERHVGQRAEHVSVMTVINDHGYVPEDQEDDRCNNFIPSSTQGCMNTGQA